MKPGDGYTAIELCAGAGGQALGLHNAGFEHLALVEVDHYCCETLRAVRRWRHVVRETDLRDFRAVRYEDRVTLVAGGVPCPPFSRAGKRLGDQDERDMFPEALRIVGECKPRAVMIENVRNLLDDAGFASYRESVLEELDRLGYVADWQVKEARNFGVPQLRPRAILLAFAKNTGIGFAASEGQYRVRFAWPEGSPTTKTVGSVLRNEMRKNKWQGASDWAARANDIAPTLVGGSKKHGGADLGPTQAKKQWRDKLGVDGLGLADAPPGRDFEGMPKLTVPMAGLLQGFPAKWPFKGGKTAAYRQVGNAFPPPVAEAIGMAVREALDAAGESAVPVPIETNSASDATPPDEQRSPFGAPLAA